MKYFILVLVILVFVVALIYFIKSLIAFIKLRKEKKLNKIDSNIEKKESD